MQPTLGQVIRSVSVGDEVVVTIGLSVVQGSATTLLGSIIME
jgi:hypothetical protein